MPLPTLATTAASNSTLLTATPALTFTEYVVVGVRPSILHGEDLPAPQNQPVEVRGARGSRVTWFGTPLSCCPFTVLDAVVTFGPG